MHASRRVVITGLGVVSSLGCSVPSFWNSLLHQGPQFSLVESLSPDLPTRVAAVASEFEFPDLVHHSHERRVSRHNAFALCAGLEALSDAELLDAGRLVGECDAGRVGVVCGTGFGGIADTLGASEMMNNGQYRQISPYLVTNILHNMPSAALSLEFGLQGPSFAPAAACATGSYAIGLASDLVRSGRADVVVAGATESAIDDVTFASFCRIGALAITPENAEQDLMNGLSRPFDAKRNGFVIGEGCGVVVVESLESALRRGVVPRAEILGHFSCSDAFHVTQSSAEGLRTLLEGLLSCSSSPPIRPDVVSAHATSTLLGDQAEYDALVDVIKCQEEDVEVEVAALPPVLVTAQKSATGHLLGAAGAVEVVSAVRCLESDTVFPTFNYESSEFLLDESVVEIVDGIVEGRNIETVLCNSFGFGGTNSGLLLRKWSE